jgi:hypothetical protein
MKVAILDRQAAVLSLHGQAWAPQHPGIFVLSPHDALELGRRVKRLNFASMLEAPR